MATSTFTAVAAVSEELRREDAETGNRVTIRRSPLGDRNTVTIHDLFEQRIARRQPARERNVDAVGADGNSFHFDSETAEIFVQCRACIRSKPNALSRSTSAKFLGSNTLTTPCIRLL